MPFYVASAQSSTIVSHAQVGAFTHPDDINLIISNTCSIQIFKSSIDQGIIPLFQLPVYGRIAELKLFSLPSYNQQLLLVVTQRLQFAVIYFDSKHQQIKTICSGSASATARSSPGSRRSEAGTMGLVDPLGRCIALHSFAGLLKIIPISSHQQFEDAFVVRVDEFHILDICFLEDTKSPTLLILYQDPSELRHLKAYSISLEDEDALPVWEHSDIDSLSRRLIPVPQPFGGALVIGDVSISFYNGKHSVYTSKPGSVPTSFTAIDGCRYLLGDLDGTLSLLSLEHEQGVISDLQLRNLGSISIPSALAYLDNGYIFVGSCHSDSQMIKLSSNPPHLSVVEELYNLGPITDLAIKESISGNNSEVVCCSGILSQGSLRIARNGLGILEAATIQCKALVSIYSIGAYLVLSYPCHSTLLSVQEHEKEYLLSCLHSNGQQIHRGETSYEIVTNCSTVWCGEISNNKIVQITKSGVYLYSPEFQLLDVYSLHSSILNGDGNDSCLVISTVDSLNVLSVSRDNIQSVKQIDLTFGEISCMFLFNDWIVLGTWSHYILIYNVKTLDLVLEYKLGDEYIPRSLLVSCFDQESIYLLCGTGSGILFTALVQNNTLLDVSTSCLGNQQICLSELSTSIVLAGGDRPSTISLSTSQKSKKLNISSVNLKQVTCVTRIKKYDIITFSSTDVLSFGDVDLQPRLHVRKVPLEEQPRRIIHQKLSSSFIVATQRSVPHEQSFLRMLDDHSYEVLDSFELQPFELCCSLFQDDKNDLIILGTALALPEQSEPVEGRLLLFSVDGRELCLVGETSVSGAVYSIGLLSAGEIVCTVNSSVEVYRWDSGTPSSTGMLECLCSTHGHIMALYLKTRGDLVLVGDLMRSLNVYIWDPVNCKLVETSRDYEPRWTVACEVIDDTHFLGAESSYNMWVLERNIDSTDEFERMRLNTVSKYHLGEFVNVFRKGSFVSESTEELSEENARPKWIFGTVGGSIGVVISLSMEDYELLNRIQGELEQIIFGIGNFSHRSWRSYWNENQFEESESTGFIDGDFLESFLDLGSEQQQCIAKSVNYNLEDITTLLNELSRTH